MSKNTTDTYWMKKALSLAMKGTGTVSPNPRVGCVIVNRFNEIIGTGFHQAYGGPHAEIIAIRSLKEVADGATMYLTLEPCTIHGKTPACAPVVCDLGLSRAVIGSIDPNPQVAGRGVQMLKDAGVEVTMGVGTKEANWLIRSFKKFITTGLPYVTVKVAQSLDGGIASSSGVSKWISSEESRKEVHALRGEVDAVLVGKQTALVDNPQLTVRELKGRNPLRFVFDRNLTLPHYLHIFTDSEHSKTIVCCAPSMRNTEKAKELAKLGVRVLPVPIDKKGNFKIIEFLGILSDQFFVSHLLVEGGGAVVSAFAQAACIDEFQLFVAPFLFGAPKSMATLPVALSPDEASKYTIVEHKKSGADLHIIAVKTDSGKEFSERMF